jgi:hypothetical protein
MAGDEEDDSHMTMKRRQKRRPVQPQLDATPTSDARAGCPQSAS